MYRDKEISNPAQTCQLPWSHQAIIHTENQPSLHLPNSSVRIWQNNEEIFMCNLQHQHHPHNVVACLSPNLPQRPWDPSYRRTVSPSIHCLCLFCPQADLKGHPLFIRHIPGDIQNDGSRHVAHFPKLSITAFREPGTSPCTWTPRPMSSNLPLSTQTTQPAC